MSWKKYGIGEKDLLIPASILIGAILISASICWSGKISWSGSRTVTVQDNQAPTGQAQTAGSGGEIKLAKRNDAPSIGTGKLEIVEFSDFQCPFCQKFFTETYSQIKSKYIDTGKVKLVFRHFPLPFHANAQKAAEAFECAYRQDKSFEYHDLLFKKSQADGTGFAVADLKQYAQDLGLNTSKFNSCLDNGEAADAVKKDTEDGQKAGVSGTPTFFINGEKTVGAQPFANFETAIEKALKN